MDKYTEFLKELDSTRYILNEPLSKHSTVRIGGPADIWYEALTNDDFIQTIKLAREYNVPVTILGRGANVLIGDLGIRGLVIKNSSKNIKISSEESVSETKELEDEVQARWDSATEEEGARSMYEFKDLDYSEEEYPRVDVTIDSGVDMPFAINYLIQNGVTGLQWYSRIPGSLGGWIYNNVHGGTHFIHEVIKDVTVLTPDNKIVVLGKQDLGLDYDLSRFHTSNEVIIKATLLLYKGDTQKARYVAMEWAKRKSIQPSISIGCIFKNISNESKEKFNYPTTSVGYIVEHVLNMKGFHIGDAYISPNHHNFIENKGNATAKDYLAVINEIVNRTKEKLGIDLELEIFKLGEF